MTAPPRKKADYMSVNNNLPIQLRQYKQSDLNFVASCFLSSRKQEEQFSQYSSHELYNVNMRKLFNRILEDSQIIICYLDPKEGEEEILLGYILYQYYQFSYLIIHHAFVKSPFRKQGIFKEMFSTITAPNMPTFITCPVPRQLQKKYDIISNPFFFLENYIYAQNIL